MSLEVYLGWIIDRYDPAELVEVLGLSIEDVVDKLNDEVLNCTELLDEFSSHENEGDTFD